MKRNVQQLNKTVWACKTDWFKILRFEDDSKTFMVTAAADDSALLQRNAKCILLVSEMLGSTGVETAYPFPFRAGPN